MAKKAKMTFGMMSKLLQSRGFVLDRRDRAMVFTYPQGGPVILLPIYKDRDEVKPVHRVMVKKQLFDAGLASMDVGR